MAKRINLKVFQQFFRAEQIGGLILIFCVALSLIIANTSAGGAFQNLLNSEFGYDSANLHLQYSASIWINDGLMAIFFLLVGLEIKREILEGELSNPKKAAMPIFAAFGGMIVPALIYFLINLKCRNPNRRQYPLDR